MLEQLLQRLSDADPITAALILALVFVAALFLLTLRGAVAIYLREVIGAVYRVGLKVAHQRGDEALAWLTSEEGIAFRRGLAARAYDLLPPSLFWLKLGVTKEQFCDLVEAAFKRMKSLSAGLEKALEADAARLAGELEKTLSELYPLISAKEVSPDFMASLLTVAAVKNDARRRK